MKIKFTRWPGQPRPFDGGKYGWTHKSCGILGRFGGCWRWKLGIQVGTKCFILDLVFGSIRVTWGKIP